MMNAKTKAPKDQKKTFLKVENAFSILNEPDDEEEMDYVEPNSHDDDNEEDEKEEPKEDVPHGIYDLMDKTVDINGVKYLYDNEYLFSGQESLNPVVIDVMNEEPHDIYPQSVNFCRQIVAEQQAKKRMFVILTKNEKENKIHFIFPINSLLDLQLKRVSCHLLFEMEKINQHLNLIETEFKDDDFPQGKYYRMSLFKEKSDTYGIHSITKYTKVSKTHYYFKYKFNLDIPKEKIRFFAGIKRYDTLSKLINKNPETFPQGKEYCLKAVKDATLNDSAVFVVGNNSETNNYILIDDEIEQVCDREWWPVNFAREKSLIHERKATELYPQGLNYILKLLQMQRKNGGRVRVLSLATPETVWFYIKGK
ncbi:hypothetical protein M9Y10_013572 [Tritrichomonas musculus]|uniref:Uncharacterized protein n=1 Tax=Tritrichomonas musculus TaxID=1915356 RepID=A0ABR2KX57_9EUKA